MNKGRRFRIVLPGRTIELLFRKSEVKRWCSSIKRAEEYDDMQQHRLQQWKKKSSSCFTSVVRMADQLLMQEEKRTAVEESIGVLLRI
ncbi:hypothetical protein B296_00006608 [Ensete ventricosum]|uniref:Uncharacterized protein n=1 Tax=Ensete ventricosum TaxID=4639 RepID=A0A427AGK5_ENSVE|nr:hypothetical protein B296_00006608 [Ensete ventricosum]